MEDYKEIKDMLKLRREIKASAGLRRKVRLALDRERRSRITRRWFFGGISLGAVAAVLLLVLVPSGMSAREILAEAINALADVENIRMTVEVRTRPVENFRYIGLNEDFVSHRIEIARQDSLLRWRVDKGERVATGSGNDILLWIPSLKLGMHLADTEKENVLGYLANLLTPREILDTELANCRNDNRTEYKVRQTGEDIILTVHSAPEGDFSNPYLLNSSIAESENIRRYVIDAATKRLKSATVSVVSGTGEIEVLRVAEINYGTGNNDICRLADGIKFIETDSRPAGLKGLSAEEAAGSVLNAFADWDETILDRVMIREVADATYRETFRGSRLVSIGRSFTSGSGNSIFVPYTLELRDGSVRRHNLALQKTDCGGWMVVGGL